MVRKTSMQDIADHLGISKNAVSLALRNLPGVSESLRQRVVEAARLLNYAGYGTADTEETVVVLTPEYISSDTIFYYDVYWHIEAQLRQHGYQPVRVIVSQTEQQERRIPSVVQNAAGVLAVGVFCLEYIKQLTELPVPVVSVDQHYDGLTMDSVVTANSEGAFAMVQYLIGQGHHDVGYIGSINATSSLYDRYVGYQKALAKAGLATPKHHCVLADAPLSSLLGDPDELQPHIEALDSYPSAWFCGGDRIAISLMNILHRKGVDVPKTVSIAGFDDIESARYVVPDLTTVEVKRDQLGVLAVDRLHQRITEPHLVLQKQSVYGELIIRTSVAHHG